MTNIPAGYYPDPAGSPQQRWWNGSSWGELQPATPNPLATAYSPSQPYIAQPYGALQPYNASQSYYATTALQAPEGTNPTTTQAWIIALWPLLGLVSVGITFGLGLYSTESLLNPSTVGVTTADLVTSGFSFLTWLAFIGLAYSDYRELLRRGVPKPFHWAYGIIPFPIVYVIGRSVVVHRRTRTGLTPLWVWIGATVISYVISFVIGIVFAMNIANSLY